MNTAIAAHRRAAVTTVLLAAILIGANGCGNNDRPRETRVDISEQWRATARQGGPQTILNVNGTELTAAEVLFPIRNQIAAIRANVPEGDRRRVLENLIRNQAQQEIGTLLLYQEAAAEWPDAQHEQVDAIIDRRLRRFVAENFGGSQARFEKHLREYGLTLADYRRGAKRSAVAQNYAQEAFLPQVHVRREELVASYEALLVEHQGPALRELLMIEMPFDVFLPAGVSWDTASEAEQAAAQRVARAAIEAAEAALADQPFETVAAEHSRGLLASNGGNWGMIGKPLQPPREVASAAIFELAPGETSPIIATATAYYIVKCGAVDAPTPPTFEEAQTELRRKIRNRQAGALSEAYMTKLAAEATISSVDTFIAAATTAALDPHWPQSP